MNDCDAYGERHAISNLIFKNRAYQSAILERLKTLQVVIDQYENFKTQIGRSIGNHARSGSCDESVGSNVAVPLPSHFSECINQKVQEQYDSDVYSVQVAQTLGSLPPDGSKARLKTVLVRPSCKISYWVDTQELKPPILDRDQSEDSQLKPKKWANSDRQKLRESIRQQNQQWLFQNLVEREELATKEEIEQISKLKPEELERDVSHIEWNQLARSVFPGRRGNELMREWLLNLAPDIKRDPFTPEEVNTLIDLQKTTSFVDIGFKLSRLPIQCLREFVQIQDNKLGDRKKWTSEEDNILKQAVSKFGDRNWRRIANELPGRTGQQCLHRWNKTLNPNIRHGKWTHSEDQRLVLAVAAFGKEKSSWSEVQKLVPGRTDVQCRERWMNILNPQINNDRWKPIEDDIILQITEKIGPGKWADVSRELNKKLKKLDPFTSTWRTDSQCRRRWKALLKNKMLQ